MIEEGAQGQHGRNDTGPVRLAVVSALEPDAPHFEVLYQRSRRKYARMPYICSSIRRLAMQGFKYQQQGLSRNDVRNA